jgi:DNA-binding NarL/FixJ family response regulator
MSTSIGFLEESPSASSKKSGPRAGSRLTPRQHEILTLLAQGLYYKEIGAELGISHATVRAHLHSAYRKLEVKSRARAAIKFQEQLRLPAN